MQSQMEEEMLKKAEMAEAPRIKRRPGRPRKNGSHIPVEKAERNSVYAREYRERMIHAGYCAMNVWVPKEWKKELMEMVFAEVERRQALQVEPRRIPRI